MRGRHDLTLDGGWFQFHKGMALRPLKCKSTEPHTQEMSPRWQSSRVAMLRASNIMDDPEFLVWRGWKAPIVMIYFQVFAPLTTVTTLFCFRHIFRHIMITCYFSFRSYPKVIAVATSRSLDNLTVHPLTSLSVAFALAH